MLCNREIKFKVFVEYAEALGATRIATGHYARMEFSQGRPRLLKGLDADKDQSYFLHAVPGEQLAKCLFPVGELPKSEVRRIAADIGFTVATKKDSTGICFIGERRFADFLRRYLPAQPGLMKSVEGEVLGEHHGLMYYTIGQRHGLDIGGPGEAWYVADKRIEDNRLIVVQGHDLPALLKNRLLAGELSWV